MYIQLAHTLLEGFVLHPQHSGLQIEAVSYRPMGPSMDVDDQSE